MCSRKLGSSNLIPREENQSWKWKLTNNKTRATIMSPFRKVYYAAMSFRYVAIEWKILPRYCWSWWWCCCWWWSWCCHRWWRWQQWGRVDACTSACRCFSMIWGIISFNKAALNAISNQPKTFPLKNVSGNFSRFPDAYYRAGKHFTTFSLHEFVDSK